MADANSTLFAPLESPYVHVRSPAAYAITVLSLIAIHLCVPPLIWHIKSKNIAASSLVGWVMLGNIFIFINSLIWATDDVASWWSGVGLCDVEVKIMLGATVAINGALACIFRSLAIVLDTDNTVLVPSRGQRNRRIAIEILLCGVFPAYVIAIHYVVQPNRYYLLGIDGCFPSIDNSWPSIVLVWMWPVVLCLLDCYYCTIVIYRLRKYRKEFASIIAAGASNLNKSRFLRLFLLSLTLILLTLPTQLYVFYRNLDVPRLSYSWSQVHGPHWHDIVMAPSFGTPQFDRWIQTAAGFLVFLFFGFGKDATIMYQAWLVRLGFAKIWPGLRRTSHPMSPRPSPSLSSRIGTSISSRAKLLFRRHSKQSLYSMQSRQASLATSGDQPSPTDGMQPLRFPGTVPNRIQTPMTTLNYRPDSIVGPRATNEHFHNEMEKVSEMELV